MIVSTASAALAAPGHAPARHSTDLRSLVELRDDYAKSATSMSNALVLRGDYAPAPWIGARIDLPMVYADKVGMRPAVGFGDVSGTATVRIVKADVSLLTGFDFVVDTAATKVLGGGKNVVGPFATVAWDLGPGVWVRLQLQHLASVGGDPKQATVNASSVRPFALVSLPEGFWMVVDQTFRVDHQGPRNFAYTAVLEGGKSLSKEILVYVDPGVELDSPFALTWSMSAGVRWVMP